MTGNVSMAGASPDEEFISIAEQAAQAALAAQAAAEAAQTAAEQARDDTLAALGNQQIGQHQDTTFTSLAANELMVRNAGNTAWINAVLTTALVGDIDLSGITNGQGVAWNGSVLAPVNLADTSGFLPLTGGTLTGALELAGNPATALQAAPKQYVDDLFSTSAPYDVGVFFDGVPGDAEDILKFVAVRDFFLLQNLPNSRAVAGVAATAITTFDLQRNGASIGSIQWAAAATTATFTLAANENFSAGDVLSIVGPTPADGTLEDISITLVGNLGASA